MNKLSEILSTISSWSERQGIVNPFEVVGLINFHLEDPEYTSKITEKTRQDWGVTPECLSNIIGLLHQVSRKDLSQLSRTEAVVISSRFMQFVADGYIH